MYETNNNVYKDNVEKTKTYLSRAHYIINFNRLLVFTLLEMRRI